MCTVNCFSTTIAWNRVKAIQQMITHWYVKFPKWMVHLLWLPHLQLFSTIYFGLATIWDVCYRVVLSITTEMLQSPCKVLVQESIRWVKFQCPQVSSLCFLRSWPARLLSSLPVHIHLNLNHPEQRTSPGPHDQLGNCLLLGPKEPHIHVVPVQSLGTFQGKHASWISSCPCYPEPSFLFHVALFHVACCEQVDFLAFMVCLLGVGVALRTATCLFISRSSSETWQRHFLGFVCSSHLPILQVQKYTYFFPWLRLQLTSLVNKAVIHKQGAIYNKIL